MRKLLAFLWRPAVSFWGSVGALALYFLSTGPVFWLLWNFHLPRWFACLFTYIYCPIGWAASSSKTCDAILISYIALWIDLPSIFSGAQPATPNVPSPGPPPFFVEVSGTLVGAWLVWNFVRWMNQRHRTAAHVAPRE